jgi:23S rRNA (cytidine1920-2'-O)/16S rRNA (cytidine1409-2'-O)-methyltransferase
MKKRLDLILVERKLVESRTLAQRLVMAGQVRVNGELILKPATLIADEDRIEIDKGRPFVSRGGEKLEAAVQAFPLRLQDRVCADVGASTGGFTDCLLQHGAKRVYAIDVGKGILHWKLRNDPRVVVMEGINARYLDYLPEPIKLTTVDASFISLRILLPVIRRWSLSERIAEQEASKGEQGQVIALIKPQFEAGRAEVKRGEGVIRDPEIHRTVLADLLNFAQKEGFRVLGLIRSPLLGPKGNTEFLAWLEVYSREIDQEIEDLNTEEKLNRWISNMFSERPSTMVFER